MQWALETFTVNNNSNNSDNSDTSDNNSGVFYASVDDDMIFNPRSFVKKFYRKFPHQKLKRGWFTF